MAVRYYNEDCSYRLLDKRRVAAWIGSCIAGEGFSVGDISYIFCSSERHLEINKQYLGHDYHTDVITFDYSDPAEKIISGDIFIDPQTVSLNALEYGTAPREEMLRVLLHGVLHLCGHKDSTPMQIKQMRAKEERYLAIFASAVSADTSVCR